MPTASRRSSSCSGAVYSAASLDFLKPLLPIGIPLEVGIAGVGGALLLSVIMLVVRRRQLGALELAFYWFVLMAPLGVLVSALLSGWFANTWESPRANFMGFLAGWLLLVVSAWFFSARRGPGLSGAAIAVYWARLPSRSWRSERGSPPRRSTG